MFHPDSTSSNDYLFCEYQIEPYPKCRDKLQLLIFDMPFLIKSSFSLAFCCWSQYLSQSLKRYDFQHSIKIWCMCVFSLKTNVTKSYIHDVICEQVSKRTVKRRLVFYFPSYITYRPNGHPSAGLQKVFLLGLGYQASRRHKMCNLRFGLFRIKPNFFASSLEEVSDKQPMVWNIMVGGLGISRKHRNIQHTDAMNKTTVHIA